MSYHILLMKNGKVQRRMGDYSRKVDAVKDAQVLADAAASGVQVYVDRLENPNKRAKKALRDVSKQLAKASKTHAKQSRRVAKVARRLNLPASDQEIRLVIDDLHGRKGKTFVEPLMKRTGISHRAIVYILEDRLGYVIQGQGIGKRGYIQRKNPTAKEISKAIGKGAATVGGYIVEGTYRAGEEAKRAALYARFKDLEACAARLGIDTDKLMAGKLDGRETLNEIADRIEDAEQALVRHGDVVTEKRKKRASKRKTNPNNGYFVGFTRPESGFRYFSRHRLKSAASKAMQQYKRKGFKDVRLTKNRPTKALPVGIFEKV